MEVNVTLLSDDLLELNLVELDNEVKVYSTSKEKLFDRISNINRIKIINDVHITA